MNWIILLIGLITTSIMYNIIIHNLTYKIELESIRLYRISKCKIRIIRLKNQIKKIKNKGYTAKALVRAEKKITKKNNQISTLNNNIKDLENYGEKGKKED